MGSKKLWGCGKVGGHIRRGENRERWASLLQEKEKKKERQEAQLSIPCKDLMYLNLVPCPQDQTDPSVLWNHKCVLGGARFKRLLGSAPMAGVGLTER